ncbi:MAG: hypothetical protein M1819_006943 [Sarea resinae]|nr:MAG: hypothetical protein M1819_006943 [Sarea resinae]
MASAERAAPPPSVVVQTDLTDSLTLVARGKVRDLYSLPGGKTLLFVATDRISAYDVIMKNGVPEKGILLNLISAHWFRVLGTLIPTLQTHLVSLQVPASIPASQQALLRNRCMQVRALHIFPIEAIVRGYITGSAWKEYQAHGTVHGIAMPAGLQESDKFPNGAIYTPSTKAEQGAHDENIHPEKAAEIVGAKYAQQIEDLALQLYTAVSPTTPPPFAPLLTSSFTPPPTNPRFRQASTYALERGIIIADTKFEFGLDPSTSSVVLVDEVLTPDSSRFWPADTYAPGRAQDSFDKQYLRDWLTQHGLQGREGVEMPAHVVKGTADKYRDAFERLTGRTWGDVLVEGGGE